MASQYDNPNPQFAKYTPAYDVNTYAQIGMAKQAQYDQNVQKIEGTLDKIAGVELIRDVDKEHLQTKLDDITTKINNLAGADWGNQRMVSQVGSMASEIYRDQDIQNAVASTHKIKSYYNGVRELTSKNPEKYPAQAKYRDDQYIQKYYNDQTPGAIYNGPSSPSIYQDYRKPLTDMLKELDPNVTTNINENGKFEYVISKSSLVSPDTIKNAVNSFFQVNPQYQDAVQMDSDYEFRNHTPDDINKAIGGYIDTVKQHFDSINKNIQTQIDANPNNADLVTKYRKILAENEGNLRETIQGLTSASDSAKKYTLFRNSITNDAIIRYQKQNIESEVKETPLANRYVEFLKAGLDPSTGEPLDVNSPLYHVSQKVKESTTPGFGYDVQGGAPSEEAKYSLDKNHDNIKSLETQQLGITSRLKQTYFNSLKESGSNLTPQQKDAQFTAYIAAQEDAIAKGNSPSKDYLDYKKQQRQIGLQIDALQELQNKTAEEATAAFPITNNKGITVNIQNYSPDGTPTGRGLYILPNSYFSTTFKKFNDDVNKLTQQINEQSTERSQRYDAEKTAKNTILEKYKSSPEFYRLKELVNNPNEYSKVVDGIIKPINNVLDKRVEYQNKLLADRGIGYAPKINIFSETGEKVQPLRRIIKQEVVNQGLEDIKDEEKIKPIGSYVDITGQQYITFSVEGKEGTQQVKFTGSQQIVPYISPYGWLQKTVDLTGSTPSSGPNTMTTDDGKLRYKIVKGYSGGYAIKVLDGANAIDIKYDSTTSLPNPNSVDVIVQSLNNVSNSIDPFTGQKYTREDLVYTLTHSQPEVKDYYTKKYNSQ
jgi:hypothetical protein